MDSRERFIKEITNDLAAQDLYSPDIEAIILRHMAEYEIVERCTDIVPHEGTNDYILQHYVASLITEGKAKGTITGYKDILDEFFRDCGKNVEDVRSIDAKIFLAKQQNRNRKSTLERKRVAIHSFFEWCVREDLLPKNPIKAVRPVKQDKEIRFPLSDPEIDALRGACNTLRERAEIEVLLSSGLRCAELCNLDLSDIDWQTMQIHVRCGKGGKDRITYINDVAAHHLRKYLMSRTDSLPYVFVSRGGQRIATRTISNDLSLIADRANVAHVHPHRFRRTFATNLHKRGMDLRTVQLLLGHSNLNTTMTYIYSDQKSISAEYSKYA